MALEVTIKWQDSVGQSKDNKLSLLGSPFDAYIQFGKKKKKRESKSNTCSNQLLIFAIVLGRKEIQNWNVEKWTKGDKQRAVMVANIELIFLFIPSLYFGCMKQNNLWGFKGTRSLYLCPWLLIEEIRFLEGKGLG